MSSRDQVLYCLPRRRNAVNMDRVDRRPPVHRPAGSEGNHRDIHLGDISQLVHADLEGAEDHAIDASGERRLHELALAFQQAITVVRDQVIAFALGNVLDATSKGGIERVRDVRDNGANCQRRLLAACDGTYPNASIAAITRARVSWATGALGSPLST
jgi:hypothetical protein